MAGSLSGRFPRTWAPRVPRVPARAPDGGGTPVPRAPAGSCLARRGRFRLVYLNSYVNNPQAVMNNEGGFLRWVMCGR